MMVSIILTLHNSIKLRVKNASRKKSRLECSQSSSRLVSVQKGSMDGCSDRSQNVLSWPAKVVALSLNVIYCLTIAPLTLLFDIRNVKFLEFYSLCIRGGASAEIFMLNTWDTVLAILQFLPRMKNASIKKSRLKLSILFVIKKLIKGLVFKNWLRHKNFIKRWFVWRVNT